MILSCHVHVDSRFTVGSIVELAAAVEVPPECRDDAAVCFVSSGGSGGSVANVYRLDAAGLRALTEALETVGKAVF